MTDESHEAESGPETSDEAQGPTPYVHVSGSTQALAQVVDQAYASAAHWWDVGSVIHAVAKDAGFDAGDPAVREVAYGAAYDLHLAMAGQPAGCTLSPQGERGEFAFPPEISDVPEDVVALWRDVAASVKEPAAIARFHDLLFERRDGNGRERASAAIDAYIDLTSSRTEVDLDTTQALTRAWQLARSVGESARETRVREAMIGAATAGLAAGSTRPGCVLPLLNALTVEPKIPKSKKKSVPAPTVSALSNDPRIDELLEQAWTSYSLGYLASEIAGYMRRSTAGGSAIDAVNRREATAYIDEATARPGLVRMRILEDAVRVAQKHGLTDLAERATALMQAIPQSELGLVTISSSIPLPADYALHVEQWLAPFTRSPDWRDGLAYFLSTSCPTGNLDRLKTQSEMTAKAAVFRSIIPTTKLNADGLPQWTAASEEERRAERLAAHAQLTASQHGQHLAEGLFRIERRYGVPAEGDLLSFLSVGGQADQTLAASVARAFIHFWEGDYEACVHVAVPKVEAAARALLRELDEGIYKTQAANTPGGYPGLYVLVQKLQEVALDDSWSYFLQWLLATPTGPNLRNEIAHGFIGQVSPAYAALILRAATLLSTLVAPLPITSIRTRNPDRAETRDAPDDLAPRSREDLLRLLGDPVTDSTAYPSRPGIVGRVARLGASASRFAAVALAAISERLEN